MLVAVRVKDDWLALMPERLQLGHKTRIERVLDASRDERKRSSVEMSWSLDRVRRRKQHVPTCRGIFRAFHSPLHGNNESVLKA